ncbi:2-epi-5-epi-valiolone synthase [Streptomyces sp. NPDC015346]|uniref:3-dehydroquinate synthase family protein n=1 Tax=Streptomyces sp. NPDC015346 TaxID=3364954 RepID=UPI0036F86027
MPLHEHSEGWTITAEQSVTYEVRVHPRILDVPQPSAVMDDGRLPPRRLAVVDAQVWALYGDRIDAWLARFDAPYRVLTVTAGETRKTRASVDEIQRMAIDMGLSRRDELVGIGGGFTIDLVGLAASELRCGTPYTLIPTTVVGLVDASVGPKRVINQLGRKNLLGTYHPARLIVLDTTFLGTLDARGLAAGLAEVKKVGEMVDPGLVNLLDRHGADLITSAFTHPASTEVVQRAVRSHLEHFAEDLRERELRRWPSYGHTVSPALEMETRGAVLHGEAVNICSLLSSVLAARRGHVDAEYPTRMARLSRRLRLPLHHELLHEPAFLEQALGGVILTRGGQQHWPVPSTDPLGHAFIEDATPGELVAASEHLRALARELT